MWLDAADRWRWLAPPFLEILMEMWCSGSDDSASSCSFICFYTTILEENPIRLELHFFFHDTVSFHLICISFTCRFLLRGSPLLLCFWYNQKRLLASRDFSQESSFRQLDMIFIGWKPGGIIYPNFPYHALVTKMEKIVERRPTIIGPKFSFLNYKNSYARIQ